MIRTCFHRLPRHPLHLHRSRPERPLLLPSQVSLTKTSTSFYSSCTRFPTSKPLFPSKKWCNLVAYGTLWPCLLKPPVNRRGGGGAPKLLFTGSDSIVCVGVKDALLAKWSCQSLPLLPEITRPLLEGFPVKARGRFGCVEWFRGWFWERCG